VWLDIPVSIAQALQHQLDETSDIKIVVVNVSCHWKISLAVEVQF
jgi:hypothetical protein